MPWERNWYFVGDFDFNCGVYGVVYKVRQVGVFCFLHFPLPPAAGCNILWLWSRQVLAGQLAAAKTRQVYFTGCCRSKLLLKFADITIRNEAAKQCRK
jgi:hypothetical protein